MLGKFTVIQVAGLVVVSVTVFDSKKEAHEKQSKEGEKEAQQSSTYCIACCKNFKSVKAYENHIPSKKHQEMILKFESNPAKKAKMEKEEDEDAEGGDMEVEEVESDEWEEDDPIPSTDCLFCSRTSASLEKSLQHMTAEHSFFLPDPEFLTDLGGLVEYLGAKVGQGHMCLWCNEKGKRFETKDDVQRHMVSKGHCKLLHEGEALLEYDEW
jgi:pre-60S factor REI1